jgi:hypothetical protein
MRTYKIIAKESDGTPVTLTLKAWTLEDAKNKIYVMEPNTTVIKIVEVKA